MSARNKALARRKAIDWRSRILGKLQDAGSQGLPRHRLGAAKTSEVDQTLKALIVEGSIVRLGSSRKALYFLKDASPTPQQAIGALDRGSAQFPGRLFLGRELKRFCTGAQELFFDEALVQLVEEGKLIRLRRSQSVYYTHRDGILPQPGQDRSFESQKVLKAYQSLVEEKGLIDVKIAALQIRAGVPLPDLQNWLVEESRMGRAHLSRGDWSLSTEEERRAAVYLDGRDGQPYLRVRLESGS